MGLENNTIEEIIERPNVRHVSNIFEHGASGQTIGMDEKNGGNFWEKVPSSERRREGNLRKLKEEDMIAEKVEEYKAS